MDIVCPGTFEIGNEIKLLSGKKVILLFKNVPIINNINDNVITFLTGFSSKFKVKLRIFKKSYFRVVSTDENFLLLYLEKAKHKSIKISCQLTLPILLIELYIISYYACL